MNKELFVSSTPHETKVGLVEDDLLAEVYLERENEYTLAGSIYKGRVTRVLPGMQSAFVDIGLERDAFLYVSDFMELEEHDDDLTDVVPANRGVQDMRQQPARAEAEAGPAGTIEFAGAQPEATSESEGDSSDEEIQGEPRPQAAAGDVSEASSTGDSQGRGSYRGRRRRRGGRRDGRERGQERGQDRSPERSPDRGPDRTNDRPQEPRLSRPSESSSSRTPTGPPPGYQPIMLPGESISKYQRFSQPQAAPVERHDEAVSTMAPEPASETARPLAAAFPEDEPIFAAGGTIAEPLHEEHEEVVAATEEPREAASTTTSWDREFRREEVSEPVQEWASESELAGDEVEEEELTPDRREASEAIVAEHHEESSTSYHEEHNPVFAAPGTMEEETIEEDEADTLRYQSSSDEGDEEFEEETQAVGGSELNGDARESVSEIHMAAIVESGGAPSAEGAHAEGEEDSEELELEEAQAQAEAMLDAEARGNGTVDARAEVRAPSPTAGYTQRTQRGGRPDRPGYERRGGDRGRRGGGGGGARRFRRRESAPVPRSATCSKKDRKF